MLCENCGKKEANVRYEENINGRVRTLNLCEECSKKLGIGTSSAIFYRLKGHDK